MATKVRILCIRVNHFPNFVREPCYLADTRAGDLNEFFITAIHKSYFSAYNLGTIPHIYYYYHNPLQLL